MQQGKVIKDVVICVLGVLNDEEIEGLKRFNGELETGYFTNPHRDTNGNLLADLILRKPDPSEPKTGSKFYISAGYVRKPF